MPDPVPTPPTPPTPPDAPARWSRDWWLRQLMLILPTNWRQIIQWLILFGCIALFNYLTGVKAPIPEPPIPVFVPPPDGWEPPSEDDKQATLLVLKTARFHDTEAGQAIVAEADYPIWRLAIKGRGKAIPDRDQGQLGSCVSFGFATAGEYTMAAQHSIGKARQDLPDMANEPIYGGSRVNANGGLPPEMRGQDGSSGSWAAKWLETVGGYVARGTYGSIDLNAYDVNRCRQWGNSGVPAELLPECQKHKAHCALVNSTAEAKTALAQGYAIGVCSNVGFQSMTRDKDGFIRASGSWGHCMAIIGYRADRPGFLIENSWGSGWVKGPKGTFADIPDGSFWADEATVSRMLRQGDSYAVSNADGFRKRKIGPDDWVVRAKPIPHRPLGEFHAIFALAP